MLILLLLYTFPNINRQWNKVTVVSPQKSVLQWRQHWNQQIILLWTNVQQLEKQFFNGAFNLNLQTRAHTHTLLSFLWDWEEFLVRIMKYYKSKNKGDFSLNGTHSLTFLLWTCCQWSHYIHHHFLSHKHTLTVFLPPPRSSPPRSQRYKPELQWTTLYAVCLETIEMNKYLPYWFTTNSDTHFTHGGGGEFTIRVQLVIKGTNALKIV